MFDFDKLKETAQAKRRREGLTYRDVAVDTGIPFSTVHQVLRGARKPDAEAVALLAAWVGLSVDRFNGHEEPVRFQGETLNGIDEVLKADGSLTDEARVRLSGLMRNAYTALTG